MRKNQVNGNNGFWEKRAEYYNRLEWVNHRLYLDAFIKAGEFQKNDVVLDVGTGTGIVARVVAPLVKSVIGVDKSQKMLEQNNWRGNMYFINWNLLNPLFADEVIDKVTARHVFHHICKDTQQAMDRCYRVLKKGGMMILSEGVPPSPDVKKDYIDIFKLKEKRLTFMEEDLYNLMTAAGFHSIRTEIFRLKGMSVRNWLANSSLPQSTQDKIFDLHVNSSDCFKRVYNMIEVDGDCMIDMKMAILTGKK